MTTAVLDPAAAITAAQRELWEEVRELVAAGPTDDFLDKVRALANRTGRKITRVHKATAAPAAPAKPASTPAPTKPAPAAPRATVTIPTKRDAPTRTGSELGRRVHRPTPVASSSPSTTPARRRPAAWLPAALLLVLLVTVTALTAGGDHLAAGIILVTIAAVAVPAARWIRRRWTR